MNPFRLVVDFFQTLPAQTERLERLIDKADCIIRDARVAAEGWHARLKQQPEPTYVYVLPPDGAPMACVRQLVAPGTTGSARFETQIPIAAGAWIVSIGPASVRGVIIGNQWQLATNDFQGQVCKTSEAWDPGTHLRVELAA